MFKLKAVNWRKLSHAYGSARDVPQLFKALTSEDATTRGRAMDRLSASLCHQGITYSATASSVPLFIELLQHPDTHDKHEILVLLRCFALGSDEDEFAGFLPTAQGDASNSALPALLEGLSLYLRLLSDPDPKIRAASSYLLTCFAGAEPSVMEELSQAPFAEADPLAQGSLILNLPKGVVRKPEVQALLREIVGREQKTIVQLAAAIRLTIEFQQETPLEAVAVLLAALADFKPLSAPYKELTSDVDDLVGDVADCLCLAGRGYRSQSLPRLAQVLDRSNSSAALKVAHALLYLTFDPNGGPPYGERTPEQAAALRAIAGSRRAWRYNSNMAEILRSFGLPGHPIALQAYLEGRDPVQAMMDANAAGPGAEQTGSSG